MKLLFNKHKPFLSYKPTVAQYIKAVHRTDQSDLVKLAFLYIKIASLEKFNFQFYESMEPVLGLLTPKEIKQMFPITKTYDGGTEFKDYLNVTAELDHMYRDNVPLGHDVYQYFMEYLNNDINMFMVNFMTAVSHRYKEEYGKDIIEEFFGTDLPRYTIERNPMDDYNQIEI